MSKGQCEGGSEGRSERGGGGSEREREWVSKGQCEGGSEGRSERGGGREWEREGVGE